MVILSIFLILGVSILFHLGCNNNDATPLSGTGINQGTCPNANEICYNDGSCQGTCYYQNEQ